MTGKKFTPTVVIHGGAWKIPHDLTDASVNGVEEAARAASAVLTSGGTPVSACLAAARVLEDDPAFDAGTGSVLNKGGFVEADAAVMDGSDLSLGAVCCARNFKNASVLADLVRTRTEHTMIAGEGVTLFAREMGIVECDPSELVTERERIFYERNKVSYNGNVRALMGKKGDESAHDTVGCVCMDADGNVAAVTTTGGIPMKRIGRVGDSPLAGCGLYADNLLGAASATGHGESMTKLVLSKSALDICASRSSYSTSTSSRETVDKNAGEGAPKNNETAHAAAVEALETMHARLGSCGGLILISRGGGVGIHFTTERMPWCVWREGEQLKSGIDEPPGIV